MGGGDEVTIYVDGVQDTPEGATAFRFKNFSHMVSDTSKEELTAFAVRLGLKLEWFQDKPFAQHFDITKTKRALAVRLGAVQVTSRVLVRIGYGSLTMLGRRVCVGCGQQRAHDRPCL